MGLVKINTDFKNIGHQEFLRPNFGYRYFFDIQKGIIFNTSKLIQLKYVLKELKTVRLNKGDLLKSEILIDIGNIDRRNNLLINTQTVNTIGSDKNIIQKGDIIIPKLQPRMGNIFLNLSHQRYIDRKSVV